MESKSYIQWSAIVAGSVLACAISIILVQFGNGIGLSVTSNLREYNNPKVVIFTIGLWVFFIQVISTIAGAYVAGRMRSPVENPSSHESELRDGAHGLLVWALSTVATAIAVGLAASLAALTAVKTSSETEEQVRTIASLADNAAIVFGFATVAGAFVSAAAAWAIATIGGDHRDKSVDVSKFITFRRTVVTK